MRGSQIVFNDKSDSSQYNAVRDIFAALTSLILNYKRLCLSVCHVLSFHHYNEPASAATLILIMILFLGSPRYVLSMVILLVCVCGNFPRLLDQSSTLYRRRCVGVGMQHRRLDLNYSLIEAFS